MPGFQQRLALQRLADSAREVGEPEVVASALASKLLELWGTGALSAVVVQSIAACAVLDGCQHPEVAQLASCGAWGSITGNINRDLKRTVLKAEELWVPEPYVIKVPCRDPKAFDPRVQKYEDASLLLPHQLFAALREHKPEEFVSLLGAHDCKAFWDQVNPRDPRLLAKGEHPVTKWSPTQKARTVPLWLHGDGVEFQDRDSLLTFSCGSLLTTEGAMDSAFYICSYPKSCTSKRNEDKFDTWFHFNRAMVWSLQSCFDGVHPSMDEQGRHFPAGSKEALLAGTPLTPEGHRFVVWALLGDQDYLSNVLRLPHWSKDEFCWLCDCSRQDHQRHWKDFSSTPGWSLKDPKMTLQPVSGHLFFNLPGVSEWNVVLDLLHVMDHNGVLGHLFGSIIHMIVLDPANRTSAARQLALDQLWGKIQETYTQQGTATRLTNLHLSMFTDPRAPFADYAYLRAVKAAETRHLVPVMVVVLQHYDATEHLRLAHVCCGLVAEFYGLLDVAGMFPSPENAARLGALMSNFLNLYKKLNCWAESANRKLFHIVPKHHMALHLAQQCQWLNSRFGWTYKAESWLGKLSQLGHSCAPGCKSTRITLPLLQKYRILLHLRVSKLIFSD